MSGRGGLLLRSDGGGAIGTGHLMRCLALGQAWRDSGGEAVLVGQVPAAIARRFEEEGISVLAGRGEPGSLADAAGTSEWAVQLGVRWAVLDGYQFAGDFQSRLQAHGLRVVSVDDLGQADACPADVIVNQNLHASAGDYPKRGSHTQLLLGARYVLLRREFRRASRRRREAPAAGRVLVTLGGSDPRRLTILALRSLAPLVADGVELNVVIGPALTAGPDLERAIVGCPGRVMVSRDPRDMPSLMDWADIAVTAAGSTCWELAYMGVPMVAIAVADNQQPIARSIGVAGIGIDAGPWDRLTDAAIGLAVDGLLRRPEAFRSMHDRSVALIDGHGPERVLRALTESAEAA